MLPLLIKYQSYGSFPLYRGISLVCIHCSILSRNGVSDKPGAIHSKFGAELEAPDAVHWLLK